MAEDEPSDKKYTSVNAGDLSGQAGTAISTTQTEAQQPPSPAGIVPSIPPQWINPPRPAPRTGSEGTLVEPPPMQIRAEAQIGVDVTAAVSGTASIVESADLTDTVDAVVVTRKENLLRRIDELRALIEEIGPVADAFDEKRATIGHNKPPKEYEPDTSGLPQLARSDLDDAILSLNIIRDQVATDRAPDTDADTLARRTVDRVFKLIGGALRWLGNLANRTIVETIAKKIADVDAQTWINLAEKAWDTVSGFSDLL